MTALSPPEHIADRRDRRRVLAILFRDGGCAHCVHRTEAWGKTICPTDASRAFPLCNSDGRMPEFKLDEDTLR